jgi:hypothetical protein
MLDRIETEPGSDAEVEAAGELGSGGEWRIRPTPSLFAEPSRPNARSGLVGAWRGQGGCCRRRETIVKEGRDEPGVRSL